MKSKWALFAGIILLTLGIILRRATDLGFEPIFLIIVGALFKTYYIVSKARSGEYKPGYELIFLFVGVLMLLSGLYLRSEESPFNPALLIVPGIVLKIVFVILFITNTRSRRKTLT